jgi:hypothetical protein
LRERSQAVVRVLDRYLYGGRWWRGEGERRYYLVELEEGLFAEVYRTGDTWVLSRTAD